MRYLKTPQTVITRRDMELFCLLFEYKIATVEKIKEYCFRSAGLKRTRMRLQKLEEMGVIDSHWGGIIGNARKIYHLTERGRDIVTKAYYPEHQSHSQLKSECWEHDIVLLDIGERLSKKENAIQYLSENVLVSSKHFRNDDILGDFVRLNSDAYLELLFKGEHYNVAIEFENSRKSLQRYDRLVNRYHLAQAVDVIFYFYKDDSIKEKIVHFESKNWPDSQPKFYFCKIEEGRDWSKKIHLSDRNGQTVGV